MSINKPIIHGVFLLVFLWASPCLQANSLSALSIHPKRILLNERLQSNVITLTNKSDKNISYRIQTVERVHNSAGELQTVENTPKNHPSSTPFIRFAPKQIRLAPGASQVIRVSQNRTTPPPGEYRSHLMIQSLPDPEDISLEKVIAHEPTFISGSIKQLLAVSVPVLLRQSPITLSQVHITKALLVEHEGTLGFQIDYQRSGDSSIFGEINALLQDTGKNQWLKVATIKGIAIHVPQTKDSVFIPIKKENNTHARVKQGKAEKQSIRITFTDLESRHSSILADQEFQL